MPAFSDPAMTSLTASITLPSGLSGKVRMFDFNENMRWKDSEGLGDLGYQTGKITGHAVDGSIAGFINGGNPGIGANIENVSCTFISDTGRSVPMNITIVGIKWGVAVGELQTFSAQYKSNGPYSGSL